MVKSRNFMMTMNNPKVNLEVWFATLKVGSVYARA